MQIDRVFSTGVTFAVLVALSSGAFTAKADVTAQISGAVKDQSGAVVPGTTVSISNVDTGFRQITKADQQGAFGFPALPVGHYNLQAVQQSFRNTGKKD